eukprot:TRINITY_DN18982_c0_g1_i1.p1 TRINITY_DN18982_c0_g1~~TRINITY_DN18982_c0_g1_i1.p1  ORF type:complete len:170 (-),score=49.27 TRINITY_DN18982_c0_g1_i1:118-627(-)
MIRRPPRSTLSSSSAASDVYKRQALAVCHEALHMHEQTLADCVLLARLHPSADNHRKAAWAARWAAEHKASKERQAREEEQHRKSSDARARMRRRGVPDYYEVLGLPDKHASSAAVREAFKKKALKCHPDRVSVARKSWAEAQFKMLNEAKDVLLDGVKRRAHDDDMGW